MQAAHRLATAAAGLILIVAAACGGSTSHSGSHHGGGMSMSSTTTSTPFDLLFIDAMIPHHQQAIAMAKEARDKGLSDPDLMAIAGNIISSQQSEIDQMQAWRDQWYPNQPKIANPGGELGMSDHEMGMDMSAMQGRNINTAFAASMLAHHEGAIRMAKMALRQAEHAQIRQLAKRIIVAQQSEIRTLHTHMGGM